MGAMDTMINDDNDEGVCVYCMFDAYEGDVSLHCVSEDRLER